MDYQICPVCRGEFTFAVTRCSECDVDLIAPDSPDVDAADLPPASELVCIRVAPVAWIQAVSDILERDGVIHRIEPASADDAPDGQDAERFGPVQLLGLYVEEENAAVARQVDHEVAVQVNPEEAAPLAEGEIESCPACGQGLEPDTVECPECGLVFGG